MKQNCQAVASPKKQTNQFVFLFWWLKNTWNLNFQVFSSRQYKRNCSFVFWISYDTKILFRDQLTFRLVENSGNGYRPALNSKNLTKTQVYRIDYFTSERISSHLYTIVLLFLPDPYSVQKGDSSFYWDTQSFIYCASMEEKQKLAGENDLTKILIQIPHHITIS